MVGLLIERGLKKLLLRYQAILVRSEQIGQRRQAALPAKGTAQ